MVCRERVTNYLKEYSMTLLMSLLVVTFNYILRTTIIRLIKWIGSKTYSSRYNTIMQFLFVTQFINSALILVLVQANFEYTSVPLVRQLFNGQFADFNSEWFNQVGAIMIQTLGIIGLTPPLDCLYIMGYARYMYYMDTGHFFQRKGAESRSKTVAHFVSSYSRPEMMIDYRYSAIMLNIFIAMMFGAGIPILFPIALFNLCIMYCLDRLMCVHYYSQPPLFGPKITETALNILQWAAVLYLALGYWMLSNKQFFDSVVLPKEHASDVPRTGHSLLAIELYSLDHATPVLLVLLLAVLVLLALFLRYLLSHCLLVRSS